jgi:hypothetical protein
VAVDRIRQKIGRIRKAPSIHLSITSAWKAVPG